MVTNSVRISPRRRRAYPKWAVVAAKETPEIREPGRRFYISDTRWDLHCLLSDVPLHHCFAKAQAVAQDFAGIRVAAPSRPGRR